MIHVAYRLWGGDGFYAKMCGTSMLSMFENTKEKVTVHIMHNEHLTPDNRGKFCYIAGQYNQHVEFHNVEEIAGDSLRKFEAAHPLRSGRNSSFYPLIVHEVFPNLDKLIFLGADTIINLDIGELWAYDLSKNKKEGYGFGAVQECLNKCPLKWIPLVLNNLVNYEDYFIDDVMLMNPAFFRENFEQILNGIKFIYDNNYYFLEQDALNYLFSKTYLKLPLKFDTIVRNQRLFFPSRQIGKAIYHFAGPKADLNTDDIFNMLYLEYFLKTPWANADMFGNLDKAFRKQYDLLKREFLRYTNLIGIRERLFLIDKNDTDKMRQIFEIKDDELVVDVSDPEARAKFLETANELKGKYLIYVLHDWVTIKSELDKRNFIEGKDFFDARIILSAKDGGVYLLYDSRAVVREM